MIRVPAGTKMTPEVLGELITKHKTEVTNRYQKLKDAYENHYEIYGLRPKPSWKPDNRISANFAKYIVDTMNGFFIGIPVKVSHEKEEVDNYLEFLDSYNDQDDNNAELSKMCSIYGSAYEMYYTDAKSNVAIAYVSPIEAFMVYDDSVLENPMFFIRYYTDSKNVEQGSYSDEKIVRHFRLSDGYQWTDKGRKHYFEGIPAVEYIENDERMGIFESALPMINAYNKAISEKANDVDYFADAYLKVLGTYLDDDDIKHIRDDRIINFDGDTDKVIVEFLQKPNGDTTQENLINRLEKLIFNISMVANISDENFGTSSGIALKYKLQSMNNLAMTKERKFRSGMNKRYSLIFSNPVSKTQGIKADDWIGIKMRFTRNFPANITEEVENAKNLSGIVSQETQLSVLSIVDNVSEEVEKLDEEQAKLQQDAVTNMMFDKGANTHEEQ